MAKLSAHGIELLRVEHPAQIGETSYRVILSYRSDGHVLRRLVALNIHDTRYGGSPHADFGWKLYKRFKPEVRRDPARVREVVAKHRSRWETQTDAILS